MDMDNPKKALQAKEKGNEAFKAGDYYAAIGHYTTAILNNRKDATFPLNRAAAYLKLGKNQDAERDCTTVLELSNNNLKALFRRGQARVGIEKYDAAKEGKPSSDFDTIIKVDPANDAAKLELQKLQEIMEKQDASKAARAQILTPTTGEGSTARRRVPITIVDDISVSEDLLKPVSTRPLIPSKQSSPTPTNALEPPKSEARKDEVATVSQPPSKPTSFKEAKQARDSIKPSRMGGGIFRPTGKHTVFTHVGPSVDESARKPTMSLFDFSRAMHSLSTASEKWEFLLDNIPPSTLPLLFKTSLEPPLLVSIFETFKSVESQRDEASAQIRQYLDAFVQVPRLSTILLFLTKAEKELIRGVCDKCSAREAGSFWAVV